MSDIDLTTQSISFLMFYFTAFRHRLSNHEAITTRISGKINAMTPTRVVNSLSTSNNLTGG